MELHPDRGCQQKSYVKRIRESLLMRRLGCLRRLQIPPVIGKLKFVGDIVAVRITSVQQKLPDSEPLCVKIGERARPRCHGWRDTVDVLRNTTPVEIHACRTEQEREQSSHTIRCRSRHLGKASHTCTV